MSTHSLDARVEHHLRRRDEAEKTYIALLQPDLESPKWHQVVADLEQEVEKTLSATEDLTDVQSALRETGSHMQVLRFLMAPPLSQDQFKLACRAWQKGTEKSGKPLSPGAARAAAEAFERWRDFERTDPIRSRGDVRARQAAVKTTAHMMAIDGYRTLRRMRLAKEQEQAVVELLLGMGYRMKSSHLVDQPGALAEDEFMHATQFETADGSSHEVDLAVGLPKRAVLALECKVSNDKTNSVKRVNDVLKKATAWKRRWGTTVFTGALLQGVFSEKEPRRLLEENVNVFWSHRLDELETWLAVKRRETAG